jgi:hypothetical protein
MGLNITDSSKLQQGFLWDANPETGIGFDQNFVKAQRINTDIFHQTGIRRNQGRVGSGDAMQDLHKASL